MGVSHCTKSAKLALTILNELSAVFVFVVLRVVNLFDEVVAVRARFFLAGLLVRAHGFAVVDPGLRSSPLLLMVIEKAPFGIVGVL